MTKKTTRDSKGRVLPGQSLNPQGRPKGALGSTGKLRAMLTEETPAILQTLVERAKQGDVQACRILLDRVIPPLRAEASVTTLPGLMDAQGAADKAELVLHAVANGEIGSNAAADLIDFINSVAKLKTLDTIEQRLAALEATWAH